MNIKDNIETREAPVQNDTVIIFPWNAHEERFDCNSYGSYMTEYQISFDQINRFLEEANLFVKHHLRKIRTTYFLLLIFVITLLSGVLLLLTADKYSFWTKIGVLFVWSLLAITFGVLLSKYVNNHFRMMKEETKKLNDNYSQVYDKIGFKWNFVSHYPGCMELRKEQKMEYVPPTLESIQADIL